MPTELDVLRIVCSRLDASGHPYRLTGSFALVSAFATDFYVDADTAADLEEALAGRTA